MFTKGKFRVATIVLIVAIVATVFMGREATTFTTFLDMVM